MRISDVTKQYIKSYLKVDYDEDDALIESMLTGAKAYIKGYTGLNDEEIDLKQDLTIALLSLCSEMYDNRQFTVDNSNINPIALSILSMHSVNLL